jgi:hypothetical protein
MTHPTNEEEKKMERYKRSLIGISLLLVILFTLLFTTPVLADTETPPEGTPVVVDTPTPTEDALLTAETATDPTAEPTEVMVADPTVETTLTAEETTPEQALVEVLNENDIVLTDENGDAIPLASEAASTVAESADPYFIAGGIYYGYSSGLTCNALVLPANCHTSIANPVSAAITAYTTTYVATATGAIFIDAGAYTETASINITSGSNLTGLMGAGSATTTITFNPGTSLSVANTIKGFTLQGLTINGDRDSSGGAALVDFSDNTGALTLTDVVVRNTNASGDGIEIVNQTGNVVMTRAQSSDNGDEGAKITNTGNVTITNSEFDLNETANSGEYGLNIQSTGTVTLNAVSVSENYYGGARISALKGVKITDSTIEKNGKWGSGGDGLYIAGGSAGAMILTNVYANDNYGTNIRIDETNGTVTLTGVEAGGADTNYGINIDTCSSSGGICTNTVIGTVTLKDVIAESNMMTNVVVTSSGAINVTNLTANYNNSQSAAAFYNYETKAPQAVTISNGYFTGYFYDNLMIWSKGNVTLNHVVANYSTTGNGISIVNTYGTAASTVTLLNTLGDNETYGNEETGLSINSDGAVTINQINAAGNYYIGVLINNAPPSGAPAVVVKNANTDGCNADNPGNASLIVVSYGAVTLSNINSSYGYGHGLWIDNDGGTSTSPVSITGAVIDYNDYSGIVVYSKGLITLTNVNNDYNNDVDAAYGGLYLDNLTGTGGITINNSSTNNNQLGATLYSNGAVLINTITIRNNDTDGLIIANNAAPTTSPAVTIKNSMIRNNGEGGLLVDSKGLITITSTQVYSNNSTLGCTSDCGVVLNNTYGTGGVTITGTSASLNVFTNNKESNGLTINTNGPVSLSYLDIQYSDLVGLKIVNYGSGSVSVSNIRSSYNTLEGINIAARGNITITNPIVQYNNGPLGGIILNNAAGTGSVTVQKYGTTCLDYTGNCSVYDNNDSLGNGYGIDITSNGTVTVKNMDVYYHPQGGIDINNSTGTGSVVIANVVSDYSDAIGINVITNGTVTISDATVYTNTDHGINVDNHVVLGKSVSITRAYATNNGATGIEIYSGGAVTLAGVTSSNNTGSANGLYVDNHLGVGGVTITYTGSIPSYIQGNLGYGVYLVTNGPISITKTHSNYNSSTNFWLNNPASTGSVTMNTVETMSSVNGYGIYIRNLGNVSLTGVTAYGDHLTELDINNSSGTGSVTLTNGSFDYSIAGNGINVTTSGVITLTNVSAQWNYAGYAAVLNNSGAPTTAPGITVQNSGALMNYMNGNLHGVTLTTKGAVKVVNTEITGTNTEALNINNTYGTAGVTLTKVTAQSSNGNGMVINTKGAVVATTISGDGHSTAYGVLIDNCTQVGPACTGVGGVTLNTVTASNSGNGLYVYSNGAITVTNLTAVSNYSAVLDGYGAYLANHLSATSAPITVKKAYVSNNAYIGLQISTNGLATIDGITATNNNTNYNAGVAGVYIDNTGGIANVVVSALTGANTFSNTYNADGLFVVTNGTISVVKATADYNQNNGLNLTTYGTGKTITLNTVTVRHNTFAGIDAKATAASTFSYIKAYDNGMSAGYDGVVVDTGSGNAFTLANSYLSGNGYNGLDATVAGGGTVYVKSSFYYGNGRAGTGDTANINTNGATLMIS